MTHGLHRTLPCALALSLTVACTPPGGGSASDTEATSDATATTGESDATSTSASSTSASASSTSTATTDPSTSTTDASATGSSTDATATDSDTASSSTSDGCDGGCNPAPLCGEPCICCCRCSEGEATCGDVDGAPAVLQCTAEGCFEPTPCEAGDACFDGGGEASCAPAPPATCAEVEATYDAIVHAADAVACTEAAECKVISGHCGVGLGGCYYPVNQAFDPAPLDDLAKHYVALQCTNGVCDCAEPPPVACVDQVCAFEG